MVDEKEIKKDVEEFNNLKKQLEMLNKELKEINDQNIPIMTTESKTEFSKALNDADNFVSGIANFYKEMEKNQLYMEECDFSSRKNSCTKKLIKFKKEDLEKTNELINYYINYPQLKTLFLEVTLRCNAKCEHCGSSCGYEIPKNEISADELKKTLLDISERYDSRDVFISVTGGEPLMRPDLFDIMKYAVKLGYHWGMTTNAMLITEKTVDKLRDANMESISISLDGLEKTHEEFRKVPGSFKKIMKAIDLLKNLETLKHLEITTVVNKKNINELEKIYQLLLEKGIKEWRVASVDPIGRASENDNILLDKDGLIFMYNFIKEKRKERKIDVVTSCSHYLGLKYEGILRNNLFMCGAGLHIGSILSNGDICVCPNVRRKELIQGNIKTDNFIDVWENKYKEFRKNRLTINEKCKKCKSFKYCRGDSLHTWNFDEKKPNMCMKEILQEEFVE